MLILLSRIVTRRMLRKLHQDDPTFQKVFQFTPSELTRYFAISPKKASTIYKRLQDTSLKKSVINDQQNVRVLTQLDPLFPVELLQINDPPYVLYCLGNMELLKHRPAISVIGTRKPSHEAMPKLKQIVTPLIEQDWCIVSGLAYGIDSYAHRLTLDLNGKTIAILGSGFNH